MVDGINMVSNSDQVLYFPTTIEKFIFNSLKGIYKPSFEEAKQLVPILVPATDTLNILIISCRSYQPDIRQINRTSMTFPSF